MKTFTIDEATERIKAMNEVVEVLKTLKHKDEDSLNKMDRDYQELPEGNLNKAVLANCLDSLEAWGYPGETTLYEIEFDIEGLKDKVG